MSHDFLAHVQCQGIGLWLPDNLWGPSENETILPDVLLSGGPLKRAAGHKPTLKAFFILQVMCPHTDSLFLVRGWLGLCMDMFSSISSNAKVKRKSSRLQDVTVAESKPMEPALTTTACVAYASLKTTSHIQDSTYEAVN